jgi:hypothetical protein
MSKLNNLPNINNREHFRAELKDIPLEEFDRKLSDLAYSDYQKTEILWAANDLAKEDELEKAMRVAEFLYTDKNPESNDEYHQMILKEEDPSIITTVRGVVCWVLQSIVVSLKTDYYPRAIKLIEKLSKDENLYVRQHATVPLEILAANVRATKNQDGSPFNFANEDRKKVESLILEFLEENKKYNRVLEYSTSIFNRVRYLDEQRALRVLNTFFFDENGKMRPNFVIEPISTLAIYYAEYRDLAYKDNFNTKPFKEFLQKVIKLANNRIKSHFLWLFWKNYTKENTDKLKDYLPLLLEGKYSDEIRAQWDFLVEKVSEDNPELAFELLKQGLVYTETAIKSGEDIRKSWLNIDKALKKIHQHDPSKVRGILGTLLFLRKNQIELGDLGFIEELNNG